MLQKSEMLMLTFLLRADEFYILTRFCYRAFFQYLIFRMAHHTIEYYLKAGLSTHFSVKDIKKFGHDLDKLRREYNACVPELDIDIRIISHINKFETMRYPGGSKVLRTLWGMSYEEVFSRVFDHVSDEAQETLACFSLADFDRIVYTLRSSLPKGDLVPIVASVTEDARIYLYSENQYFSNLENSQI